MKLIVKGTPDASKPVKQCKSCPFRVDVVWERDVPSFEPGIEGRISATFRDGIGSITDRSRVIMACHLETKSIICAGWLHHQLGSGNNLAVRIAVASGRFPHPIVFGEQRDFASADASILETHERADRMRRSARKPRRER